MIIIGYLCISTDYVLYSHKLVNHNPWNLKKMRQPELSPNEKKGLGGNAFLLDMANLDSTFFGRGILGHHFKEKSF